MDFVAACGKTNVDLLFSGFDRLPTEGEEVYGKDFRLTLGGGAPATMINCGRLNVPARIGTWLGDDLFSRYAADRFSESGVDVRYMPAVESFPLNVTAAIITPHDRTFVTYGPDSVLTQTDETAAYELMHGARVALMQNCLLPVYKRLHAEGSAVVFDMGWTDDLSYENYSEYITLADYYTPNTREALRISGADTPREALDFLAARIPHPLVKLDRDGCILRDGDSTYHVPAVADTVCVDSTGAGDAYLAGFIYGLYHGYSFLDCAVFGNLTGARCVTAVGCLTNYLTETELLAGHAALRERVVRI